MTFPEVGARWRAWADRCERFLLAILPTSESEPRRLHAAMHHAVLGGGKRMRPLLVYATGTALGADESALDAPASAIELIHAYSLVHDDLPAMDDDAMRRGRPTVHVAFDEATAILAGDALQAEAFALLADGGADATSRIEMLRVLARASGSRGMVGGQARDLDAVGGTLSAEDLRSMHGAKTGALIRAAVQLGAIAAGATRDARELLDAWADMLGLAFQIRDDILDVEGDTEVIGKTAGKDAADAKPTFVSALGLEASRAWLDDLDGRMRDALSDLDADVAELVRLGQFAIGREH